MNRRNRAFATIIIFIIVFLGLIVSAISIFQQPSRSQPASSLSLEELTDLLSSTTKDSFTNPIIGDEQTPISATISEPTQTITPIVPMIEDPIAFEPTPSEPDPDNLIINGYFLDNYSGWKRELIDEGGSSKTNIVSFGSSQFNRALHLSHEGLGDIIFSQTIEIPSTNLVFSASFNATSTEGLIWGFSGTGYAMIVISYEDVNGEQLGFTRIINFNENLFAGSAFVGSPEKLSDTNTSHNHEIDSEKTYKDFSINIGNELQNNLLGINESDVKAITIAFIVGSNDKNASAELIVADVVLKPK